MAFPSHECQSDGGEQNEIGKKARSWSDLPPELLSSIAEQLGIIDLLSFRSSCKDWQSASYTASAQIQSSPDHSPWFILCGEDSTCQLYDQSHKKKYTIDIPELEGAACLASGDGWLLMLRSDSNSIFFFCPFSRAMINLPQFPPSKLSDHVAAFSSPPTSPDCVVSVISRRRDQSNLELRMISRRDDEWTKHEYRYRPEDITGAIYHDGILYYLLNDNLLTFSLKDESWKPYRVLQDTGNSNVETLPFAYRTNYFSNSDLNKSMELGDGDSVSICGTAQPGNCYLTLINNEKFNPSPGSQGRHLQGIWIHPRFLQIPPNQSWSL